MNSLRFLCVALIVGVGLVLTSAVLFTFVNSNPSLVILTFIGSAIALFSASRIGHQRHDTESGRGQRRHHSGAVLTMALLLIALTCIGMVVIDSLFGRILLALAMGLCAIFAIVRLVAGARRR